MTDKKYIGTLVSHTHWDRAWYVPFEVFRVRLVRLIDRLIDLLDRDPAYRSFMLDGQVLPIEDYLAMRPERRGDLERLVRGGRLVIGPWYALADEYLVSPEALIRNLLIGTRTAEALGGCMREGYVPDSFGHIAQLPQILQGFGIGSAVFWRGVGDEGERLHNEFWWQAPDGTKVLAIHLPDGYHNASNLGYPMRWGDPSALTFDPELALDRLAAAVATLGPVARTPYLLLMNGIDHAEPDPHTPEVVIRANAVLPDITIEHGALAEYVSRVRAHLSGGEHGQETDALPVFQGEFNRGRYTFSLQGTHSTRMVSQAGQCARAETLLERYAEPLSALAALLGEPYPAAFLDHAWRTLLKNHPHDDICGCSVDPVHRENMMRYETVMQLGQTIARDSFRAIARRSDRSAQPGPPFIFFNPLAWPFTGVVEVSLLFDRDDPLAEDFRLVDAAGRAVPCQVLSRAAYFDMEVLKGNRKQEVRAAVRVDDLPACGYRVYYALPASGLPGPTSAADEVVEDPVVLLPNGMQNRYLTLTITSAGTLDVEDRQTGRLYRNLCYLLDDEDAGDEYDYSPAAHGETVISLDPDVCDTAGALCSMVHAGPLQVTWQVKKLLRLPVGLLEDRSARSAERVVCPVILTITMRHDSPTIELSVEVENNARDHRLRIGFPTGLDVVEASAGGHFDVVTRPVDLPEATGWQQPPAPAQHQREFVDVSDGQAGLAVFSRGLPEYEILRNGTAEIAVTLLRCVGSLSRGDLLTRPGHAGMDLPTPDAQCPGRHTFELAVRPHAGDWHTIYRDAAVFAAPLYVRRGDETEGYLPGEIYTESTFDPPLRAFALKPRALVGDLPGELSFLSLSPDALVLSAVKRSEDGEALIVRCYNPTAEALTATLDTCWPVERADLVSLDEKRLVDAPTVEAGRIRFAIGPKQVRTIAVRFARHPVQPRL